MKYGLLLCVFCLAACGGGYQPSNPKTGSAEWLTTLSDNEREVYFSDLCEGQGYIPHSDDFFYCVVELDQTYRYGLIRNDFYAQAMR